MTTIESISASNSSAPALSVVYRCPLHGIVEFYGGNLPTCPHCGRMLVREIVYPEVRSNRWPNGRGVNW